MGTGLGLTFAGLAGVAFFVIMRASDRFRRGAADQHRFYIGKRPAVGTVVKINLGIMKFGAIISGVIATAGIVLIIVAIVS